MNLDYDDPQRKIMRQSTAVAAIQHNSGVIDDLALEDLLPQVHERLGDEIITHHMSGELFISPAPNTHSTEDLPVYSQSI